MPVSGSGVLDSDTAHDGYHGVLDRYDANMPMKRIHEWLAAFEAEVVSMDDPLELECLLAATVKVLWEIGHLDGERVQRLQRLIGVGKSRALWASDGGSPELAKARDGVLNRLLKQVAEPKAKPRSRRRYPQVKQLLFEMGDCLELTTAIRVYRAVVCRIDQRRGRCDYVVLVMGDMPDSTLGAFRQGNYFGHYIPRQSAGKIAGPYVIRIDHPMLVREGNPLRVVGRLALDPDRYMPGSWGGVLTLQDVVDDFNRTLTKGEAVFSQRRLPLAELLRA